LKERGLAREEESGEKKKHLQQELVKFGQKRGGSCAIRKGREGGDLGGKKEKSKCPDIRLVGIILTVALEKRGC